jgi:hypothetical protein
MSLFGGSSKSTAVSNATDQGNQTGDEPIIVQISGGGTANVSSDTPSTLRYLTQQTRDLAGELIETSAGVSQAQLDAAKEANRRQSDTASQLNLSLAEGIKELNLRSTETKAATTTARNLLLAAVAVIFLIFLLMRKGTPTPAPAKPAKPAKNDLPRKSK